MESSKLLPGLGAMEDVVSFPVSFRFDSVDGVEQLCLVLAQNRLDLGLGPDVVLALLALAVRVERAEKRPFGAGHLASQPGDRLFRDLFEEVIASGLVGFHEDAK